MCCWNSLLRQWYVCRAAPQVRCPLSRAMDGCISCRGTISSCQSAATSKIVKRCCSRIFSCKQHYIKYPDLYLCLIIKIMIFYQRLALFRKWCCRYRQLIENCIWYISSAVAHDNEWSYLVVEASRRTVSQGILCAVFQGLAGLLASIASVITIWLGSSPVQTGFAYFLIALVVMLSALLIFFVLIRLVSLRLLMMLGVFTFWLSQWLSLFGWDQTLIWALNFGLSPYRRLAFGLSQKVK